MKKREFTPAEVYAFEDKLADFPTNHTDEEFHHAISYFLVGAAIEGFQPLHRPNGRGVLPMAEDLGPLEKTVLVPLAFFS
ncbi:MAG: hypothetical protein QXG22_02200 [Candidatus Hadarchaeales archaeon]